MNLKAWKKGSLRIRAGHINVLCTVEVFSAMKNSSPIIESSLETHSRINAHIARSKVDSA